MEKVKVSHSIAEGLDLIKELSEGDINDAFLRLGVIKYNQETVIQDENMKKLSPLISSEEHQKLFNALQFGYEVEEEYRIDDWVLPNGEGYMGDSHPQKITKKSYNDISRLDTFYLEDGYWSFASQLRHATQEEIASEKERRFWMRHNRDSWQLKQGDIVMGTRRKLYEITGTPTAYRFYYTGNDSYDFEIEECKKDKWEVLCFNEGRLD